VAVYVDNGKIAYRGMKMCHMLADELDDLHATAGRLGLKRSWFQNHKTPHYDICQAKRALALSYGAISIQFSTRSGLKPLMPIRVDSTREAQA
jgi:hypothetical protein